MVKLTVASQQKDSKSMRLICPFNKSKLRHSSSALNNDGDWTLLSDVSHPYPMVYSRTAGQEVYVVALNPAQNQSQRSSKRWGASRK